jgi:hypothetical protein
VPCGKSNVLSVDEILNLEALLYLVLEDYRRIIRSFHYRHDNAGRTLSLLNNKRLRHFFKSRQASGFLISDDSRRRSGGPLSVSFATAALVEFLRSATSSNPRFRVLTVFCRTPDFIKNTSPERTMMLSLLSQLMLQYDGLDLYHPA